MTHTDPIKALVGLEAELKREFNALDYKRDFLKQVRLQTILAAIEALKPMADGTHVVVPREPTREMWGNDLVRLLIRWCGHERPTPKRLLQDLEMGYGKVPPWLEAEAEMQDQDHVVSKGTRAVFIYRAMIAAAPAASPAPFDEGVVERIVKAFEGVLLDINFAIEQGILPNIMNDMIYVEARAALAAIKGVE